MAKKPQISKMEMKEFPDIVNDFKRLKIFNYHNKRDVTRSNELLSSLRRGISYVMRRFKIENENGNLIAIRGKRKWLIEHNTHKEEANSELGIS